MNQPLPPERRVLRSSEVCRRAGLCDMQIRRLERVGSFPKRFKLNPAAGARGATGWDSAEFEAWLEERKQLRIVHGAGEEPEGLKRSREKRSREKRSREAAPPPEAA